MKTGWKTSEAHLTAALVGLCGVLTVVVMPALDKLLVARPDLAWVPPVAQVVSAVVALLGVLGYGAGRTKLKAAEVAAVGKQDVEADPA